MSEKYMPTTEDVRACHRTYWFYGRVHGLTREEAIEQANTEFDRWLAKVKAEAVRDAQREAWEKGRAAGYRQGCEFMSAADFASSVGPTYQPTNPHEEAL